MSDSNRQPICEMRLSSEGRRLTVALVGELDMSSTTPLDALTASMTGDFDEILVDVSELTFIDSSGLNALVALRRTVTRLSVQHATPPVRRVVELTGLNEFLDLQD